MVNHITPFIYYNESWRQVKTYLKLPSLLIDICLSKLLDYIPKINYLYDSMAAKIDTGTSFNSGPGSLIGSDLDKIELSDINDLKLKKSLVLSGLLKSWNIYRCKTNSGESMIYLSKDILNKGDRIHGSRLSIRNDVEFYVVVAKHTDQHDKMADERTKRYDDRIYKKYRSKVRNRHHHRGLLCDLVKLGYLDLVKLHLNNQTDLNKKRKMMLGYQLDRDSGYLDPMSLADKLSDKSIKNFLNKTLYDLWIMKNKKVDE